MLHHDVHYNATLTTIACLTLAVKMVYRANERLKFSVPSILYLLVVGDSGSGKSKARTIVYKAIGLLVKMLDDFRKESLSEALKARVDDLMKRTARSSGPAR